MSPIERPTAISTRASVSRVSSRTSWARVAPSASRTASSRDCSATRARCRLATFAQPIASTMSGNASIAITIAKSSNAASSGRIRSARTRGAALARVLGCDAAMRAAETVSWRSTSVVVRPAFTRPTTLSQAVSSDGPVGHCGARARGIQACTPCESSCPGSGRLSPWKRAGATPTTVNEFPPSSTGRPIASSRPSRWVRQK